MARYAWGIDIGDGNLKAIRLKLRRNTVQAVQAVEIPYADPFLRKTRVPASFDRRAVAALLQLGNSVGFSPGDTFSVLFPSFHVLEGAFEIPRVDPEKREELIRYEVADLTRTSVEALTLRHAVITPVTRELELVRIQAVRTEELNTFLRLLREAEVPYDRIVLPGAALAETARLCGLSHGPYLVLSLGFTAAVLAVLHEGACWARTLPLPLPVAPGTALEAAREKVKSMCEVLKQEVETFLRWIPGGKALKIRKVFLTGEGARIPAILNALDTIFTAPVEQLRPSGLGLKPERAKDSLPPEETVLSMGKALGLAAGGLRAADAPPSMTGPMPERKRRVRWKRLFASMAALLLLAASLGVLAEIRAGRLARVEDLTAALAPSPRANEMDELLQRLEREREALELLLSLRKRREVVSRLRKTLWRMEAPPPAGAPGEYHLENVEITFTEAKGLRALLGTRVADEEGVKKDLRDLFAGLVQEPGLSGPFPSGEENPPEGLAPLVEWRVEGALR